MIEILHSTHTQAATCGSAVNFIILLRYCVY